MSAPDKDLDPRLHFVVATAIIVKPGEDGKNRYLLMRRALTEKAFPGRWTVPGGKLVRSEYEKLPYKTEYPQWYGMMDWLVKKEVREEAGIEVDGVKYLTDLVFIRPDGFPVVTMSFWCMYKSGETKAGKDLIDAAWVSVSELDKYDLIEGIADEIREVEHLVKEKVAI